MLRVHLFCVIIGLITPYVVSKHKQFYRKDYTYVEEYDAFYKVHWDVAGSSWSAAFVTCKEEGAKLFYPSGDEWTIIKNLTETMTVPPNTTEIYVGLHDEFHLGEFITIDGNPTDSPLNVEEDSSVFNRCILMDYVTGQFRVSDCAIKPRNTVVPFVCKKLDDKSCPTIDYEYKYDKNTKKCFKVNIIPKTWQSAMQTCYMEGGILAIFEDNSHVDWLTSSSQRYYVGFRRMFSSTEYYTVRGNKFINEKFLNENSNNYQNPDDDCGVIRYMKNEGLKIRATGCFELLPFICEMAVK